VKRLALAAGLALCVASPALAQRRRPPRRVTSRPPAKPAVKKKEDKPEKPPKWFAVHAGQVHTVTQGVRRDVTILAKNGKITAIGRDLQLPKGTVELDAKKYRVYPGLIAYNSFGILGSVPEDSTNVFGLNMALALSQGITTAGQGNTIAKLTYGTLEGHLVGTRRTTLRLSLRGATTKARLRADLQKVRDYQRKAREYRAAVKRGEKPAKLKPLTGKLAGYLKLVNGETWAYVRADSARDLNVVAALAETYGFKIMIEGGAEAWTLAPRLGRLGCRVILTPRSRRYGENERSARPSGWSIENAAILFKSGVSVTITSQSGGIGLWGLAGKDLFTLPLEGAYAIRGGLPRLEALKGLTIHPARFMGVDDQLGSIEVGKDCDLVITRGDILHYRTLPLWTVVNGRVAYDKQKDSLLRHVRPRDLKGENLKLPVLWPRRKGSQEPEMPKRDRD
jgi:hypothetical protein